MNLKSLIPWARGKAHIQHSDYMGGGWLLLNNTLINYQDAVTPSQNSIILACIGWVQRVFSEAPPMLQTWLTDRRQWEDVHQADILELLERPNRFYNGTTLWKATIADRILSGTAYWAKERDTRGRVIGLWWLPESIVEPKDNPRDPTVFIDHYEYSPRGVPLRLEVDDVIRFPDGIDTSNNRKGLNRMRVLLREIYTDDEAANMTASLMRNMGVPGIVIAPKQGMWSPEIMEKIKDLFLRKTTGDERGKPLVLQGDATVIPFGFSPEQLKLRDIRGLPEERITAVIGVNAAVVGLGAGLATTKVGATLKEYREEAFESTIMPLYRELASELTVQLLPDFQKGKEHSRLAFDLTKLRVLQEDEMVHTQRVTTLVNQGLLTVGEGRRALGWPVLPEHEVYLRPANVIQVPTGPLHIPERREPSEGEQRSLAAAENAEAWLVAVAKSLANGHSEST